MPDDKKPTGKPDHGAATESYEIAPLMRETGRPRAEVEKAIKQFGPTRARIVAALKKKGGPLGSY